MSAPSAPSAPSSGSVLHGRDVNTSADTSLTSSPAALAAPRDLANAASNSHKSLGTDKHASHPRLEPDLLQPQEATQFVSCEDYMQHLVMHYPGYNAPPGQIRKWLEIIFKFRFGNANMTNDVYLSGRDIHYLASDWGVRYFMGRGLRQGDAELVTKDINKAVYVYRTKALKLYLQDPTKHQDPDPKEEYDIGWKGKAALLVLGFLVLACAGHTITKGIAGLLEALL